MSAYTVVKNDGRTLVTTVINANDAASVGGNSVTMAMPSGFSVSSASRVFGESNDVKSATQVVPAIRCRTRFLVGMGLGLLVVRHRRWGEFVGGFERRRGRRREARIDLAGAR